MASGFDQTLKWTFGLRNYASKYLTAETYQHKVTTNSATMKRKQIWILELVGDGKVALKSHLNRYLSIDKNGDVSASAEEIGGDETLELITQLDGRVAILSSYGRYLGGSGDRLSGFDRDIGPTSLFVIHLAIHPQINLRNVNRGTYCHLARESDEMCCSWRIPWGSDAPILLEFHENKYALRAANGMLLKSTGELAGELSFETLYTIEFRDAQIAFKDCAGKYLSEVGAAGVVQSRKGTIGKGELFAVEDSHAQFQLTASNGKLLSIRSGIEVHAKQREATDTEIFQMEAVDRFDYSGSVKWAIRANNEMYWSSIPGLIVGKDNYSELSTHFEIEWHGPMIAMKGSNGKYISVRPNGSMGAYSAECTEDCLFVFELINRPLLVLRGEYGFVGVKGSSGILECNQSQYDIFRVTCNAGIYHIQDTHGKYMGTTNDGHVTINNDQPTGFFFELRAHTRMAIRAPNGSLLRGTQNGDFTPTGSSLDKSTLWEY